MGVVTVSSSATQSPLGIGARFSTHRSALRKPFFLAFQTDKSRNSASVAPQESVSLPIHVPKDVRKSLTKASSKAPKRVEASSSDGASTCTIDLDYNEAAAKLENIYKLSSADVSDGEYVNHAPAKVLKKRKRIRDGNEKDEVKSITLVRNHRRKMTRLSLEKRIALRQKKGQEEKADGLTRRKGNDGKSYDVDKLVREYSLATDIGSLDWKKMKIPPVLPSSEHMWLFKLMQPMKALFRVKEGLHKDLGREPSDGDLATATKMGAVDLRRKIEVGQAARNKLIKHNLRLVLFVINKYYQDIANDQKFQDLCQAGGMGLITAIDRFQPKRGFRLSTYGLFWIRHAIIRSTTVSSFMRVPFGIHSAKGLAFHCINRNIKVRQEIQKAKLELLFEHERLPTDEEIIDKVGISPERYQDVMKASKQVLSLNARHMITQEEFIDGIADVDGVGSDKGRQSALLRLALDDVLDSLKPKESLVIRQRYGLDGRGDRTLGEIAGNLNISREMVRKHEMKALMKLKHPARVDYLRRHIV